MKTIRKMKYIITVIIIAIIAITIIYLKKKLENNKYNDISLEEQITTIEEEKEEETICSVDIKGAIKKPGVYSTNCDSNIKDIISLAGGLNDNADTSVTNLAKKINNEMVIIIYTKEQVKNSNIVDTVVKVVEKECVCPNIQNDGCINTEITSNIGENNDMVNINTATLEILQTLPGIGESKAKAIIKYREENGNFEKIEDIKNVEGIGTKLYEDIKAYITV